MSFGNRGCSSDGNSQDYSPKACRVCLAETALVNMFKPVNHCGHYITKLVMSITEVEIYENDGLPYRICSRCLSELKVAVHFKKKCEETDNILRKRDKNSVKQEICCNDLAIDIPIEPVSVKQELVKEEIPNGEDSEEPMCYVECLLGCNQEIDLHSRSPSPTEDALAPSPPKVHKKRGPKPKIKDTNQSVKQLKPRLHKLRILKREIAIAVDGDDEYNCDMCIETFTSPQQLKKHIKRHSDTKLYQCEVCKKLFRQNSHLQRHLLIHTGLKPFTCEICQKSFKQKPHLTRHVSVHTGRKPYQCEVCGKKFITTSDLNKHSIIHTGTRPFQCELCGKGYNNVSDLNKHLLRKHEIDKNRFQCTICFVQFSNGKNLNQHMLVHCQSDTIWTKVAKAAKAVANVNVNVQALANMANLGASNKSVPYVNNDSQNITDMSDLTMNSNVQELTDYSSLAMTENNSNIQGLSNLANIPSLSMPGIAQR